MDSPYFNKKVEAKLEQLRQLAPAEAKAIDAAKRAFRWMKLKTKQVRKSA